MSSTSFDRHFASACTSELGTVGGLVGELFESYVRIIHPAKMIAEGAHPVKWSEIAAKTGRPYEPATSSFYDVSGYSLYGGVQSPMWTHEPLTGEMRAVDMLTLIDVLRRHTARPDKIMIAVWPGFPIDVPIEGTRIYGNEREYLVRSAQISLALDVTGFRHPANLWGPEGGEWMVTSDIALPSTFVGGSRQLIAAITKIDSFETAEVGARVLAEEPTRPV